MLLGMSLLTSDIKCLIKINELQGSLVNLNGSFKARNLKAKNDLLMNKVSRRFTEVLSASRNAGILGVILFFIYPHRTAF